MDIVKKLADMLGKAGGQASSTSPGSPLGVPLSGTEITAAAGGLGGAATSGIAPAPTTAGPAADAGVLPGGNSPMDILLRTLKGAQAGQQMGQQMGQQAQGQPQQMPAMQPMQMPQPQGMVMPQQQRQPYKRY